ncbi:sensor histidine kinase KdpD [Kribbella sp. VKM Ac-2566]|jgi:signal transduction histidine kinase|uniref:sensor histidine kinase n=1 Tax=Kribbella sp. VKM Ac-2566 TaxID=2512218 RepID=UPI0010E6ABA5|nr:HAMP domain-containing sensor histidine kinase [Kribbella sp. VKM Ac-2566]TDW98158.1 phospho-acceptor domain-containing protein [Kribbella sp. VKM Ac-2566]
MSQRGMRGPSADRLRRLRWWLTVLFTATNTVALIVLAPVIIILDAQRGADRIDHDLSVVTQPVLRLIDDNHGALVYARVPADPLASDCPDFAVMPGKPSDFTPLFSTRGCTRVDTKLLADLAAESVRNGAPLSADRKAVNGHQIRVAVEPFKDSNGHYFGAVLAWQDTQKQQEQHRQLTIAVLVVCAILIGAAALISYWLSGRAIRPAMAALEQQETLLAETAHDLRTPVAALRALAETAQRDPEQRAELLPRTVRLAGRMGDIIDGLLVRARLAAGVEHLAMQPVWLDQLVAGVVEDMPTGDARFSLVTAPTMVRADPTLLRRAIGNVLGNAMRHGRVPGADLAIITVTVADGRVTVADQGPGIDPTVGADLFEPYTTGGASTGLGLSIVRWVVLAHGGDLKVYNADEGGAIFEIQLPTVQ